MDKEKEKESNGVNDNESNKSDAIQMRKGDEDDIELDGEGFPEDFRCCVCLELLYKPVVLACGHLSCFWCVFKAMNAWHESYCPVCRHPYNHFPSICQLLHFLLLKLYPVAYKGRERQVEEEEKEVGYFSPQFDHNLFEPCPSDKSNVLSNTCNLTQQQAKFYLESCSKDAESLSFRNLAETMCVGEKTPVKPETSPEKSERTANVINQECNWLGNNCEHGDQKQLSIADLPCAACKKLLFRPVVLNCGHVYCEPCMFVPEDEIPRCEICQSLHPNGLPSVCLILDHFLEEQFSEAYSERREALLNKNKCSRQTQQNANRASSIPSKVYTACWFGNGPKVHFGVGCDCCGMSPIVGERYRCIDCLEKIGFDLCEACYSAPAKIAGRFNQQHKADHKFEIVKPQSISNIISRLNSEQSDDDSSDYPEYLDDGSQIPTLSADAPEDQGGSSGGPENVSSAFILSADVSSEQDDSDDPAS